MRLIEPRYLGSRSDVVQCLRTGVALGAILAASELFSPYHAWRRLIGSDIHPWLVASVIFFGACFAGLFAGVVRPLTRRLSGAVAVAIVAIFPALIALDVIRRGPLHPPYRIHWAVDALAALALGIVVVLILRGGDRSNRTL